jgi:hypothetical protein
VLIHLVLLGSVSDQNGIGRKSKYSPRVFWVEVRGGQKKAVARSEVFRDLCGYRAVLTANSGIHNKRCVAD